MLEDDVLAKMCKKMQDCLLEMRYRYLMDVPDEESLACLDGFQCHRM